MAHLNLSLPPPPPPPSTSYQEQEDDLDFHLPSPMHFPPPTGPHVHSTSLLKQHSWSPDIYREEAWTRRKGNYRRNRCRSKSVTDEDLDELKACIELGFGFDSPEVDQRLSDTLPALDFYHAVVNKQYSDIVPRPSTASSAASDCDSATSSVGSPLILPGMGSLNIFNSRLLALNAEE